MKNYFVVFLCTFMIFSAPLCLNGQGGLYLDFGLNSAALDIDAIGVNSSRKTGYYLGLHFAEFYKNGFEFGSNVQYSAKGATLGFIDPETYNYLDAMATIGYRPVDMLTIFAGGAVGRLLANDDLFIERDLDMGVVIGAKLNFEKAYLKAHYNRGLITQVPTLDIGYNDNIQIGIGLFLDLKPTPVIPDTSIVTSLPMAADSIKPDVVKSAASSMPKEIATDEPKNYQVGLRLSGFDRFDMIYKIQSGVDRYVRWGVFTTDINYTLAESDRYAFAVGFSVGSEFHEYLDEKTYFAHGPQFEFALNFRGGGFEDVVDVKPGFGYLVGIYHKANDRFSVGLELMPKITYTTQIVGTLAGEQSSFDLEFGTTNIGLVVAYRFNKLKK